MTKVVKSHDVPKEVLDDLLPSVNVVACKPQYNEVFVQSEWNESETVVDLVFKAVNSEKKIVHVRTVTLRWVIPQGANTGELADPTKGGWRVARMDEIPTLPANYVEASRRGNSPLTVIY